MWRLTTVTQVHNQCDITFDVSHTNPDFAAYYLNMKKIPPNFYLKVWRCHWMLFTSLLKCYSKIFKTTLNTDQRQCLVIKYNSHHVQYLTVDVWTLYSRSIWPLLMFTIWILPCWLPANMITSGKVLNKQSLNGENSSLGIVEVVHQW